METSEGGALKSTSSTRYLLECAGLEPKSYHHLEEELSAGWSQADIMLRATKIPILTDAGRLMRQKLEGMEDVTVHVSFNVNSGLDPSSLVEIGYLCGIYSD